MLTIHTWMQPYKLSWHNRLDAFIFATLALVNIITLYRYVCSSNHLIEAIQIGVAYLPLMYLAVYITRETVKVIKRLCYKPQERISDNEVLFSISELNSRYDDIKEMSTIYKRETT